MRRTWKDIGARAKKIRSRGKIARFIGSEKDAKALEGLITEINTSIQDKIMVGVIVTTFGSIVAHLLADTGHIGKQDRPLQANPRLIYLQNIEAAAEEINENIHEARQDIDAMHTRVKAVCQLCFEAMWHSADTVVRLQFF